MQQYNFSQKLLVPLQRDYTIYDIVLKLTSEIKDLGEVFTQTLNWDCQVQAPHVPERF